MEEWIKLATKFWIARSKRQIWNLEHKFEKSIKEKGGQFIDRNEMNYARAARNQLCYTTDNQA